MSHWESSGQSDDWYTPKYIFDALDCHFDCDVASPVDGVGTHVPASRFISEKTEITPHFAWEGFIWMNPPFGPRGALWPWLEMFIDHGNGIALTPDRTSAPWFQRYADSVDYLLFLPKVKFLRPDGSEGKSPSCGTVLWGIGPQAARALKNARNIGQLMRPA